MESELIKTEFDLTSFNTLALPSRAQYFCKAIDQETLMQALLFAKHRGLAISIVASGSNVVLPEKISGMVINPNMQGIVRKGNRLRVAAGVLWDHLVRESIYTSGLLKNVKFNNGHFLHQMTAFIGPVNFYWEINGKKFCKEMDTGYSNYITPFWKHSFTTRSRNREAIIVAVTFWGDVARARNELYTLGHKVIESFKIDSRNNRKGWE